MNLRKRWISTAALATVAVFALSACSGSPEPEPEKPTEMTTLKVATIGLTSDGSLLAGIEQGFFEEEGLEIETSVVANPPAGIAAAQGGQVDIAYAPSIPILNALSQGVPLQVIAGQDGFPEEAVEVDEYKEYDDTALFASAASGITEVKDLAGKTIAVPARKAQLEVVIADLLSDEGIDPATGVNWVVLDFTSAVAALQSGTVDAAGLVSPFNIEAEKAGATYIASPSFSFFETGAVGLWVAGTPTVEAKPEAIAAFQRAILKSNQWAIENPKEAIQAGLDYTGSKLTVDDVKVPIWQTKVTESDLDRPNQKLVKLGFLPAAVELDGVIYTAK